MGGPARHLSATDVRRLAFRAGVFDLIFSPSSLDHFDDVHEIETALRELHHALAPGGRLPITLDNPANPVLRARQVVHWLAGRIGGLIPFRMGRTLARRACGPCSDGSSGRRPASRCGAGRGISSSSTAAALPDDAVATR